MVRHLAKLIFLRVLIGGVVTAALIVVFSLPGSAQADGSFDTTTEYFFCNQLPSGFGGPSGPSELKGPNVNGGCTNNDYSPEANPNWGFTFDVPSGDYNFSTFAVFMSDGFSIAADADFTDGTVIGGIRASLTIGLTGGVCNNTPTADFILYDSTTNTANTVDALAEGERNRFRNLKTDNVAPFNLADADSPAVVQYPSFLNTLLDPDLEYPGGPNGSAPPISPHARYTGLTVVGTDWIFLTILVFEKADLDPFVIDPANATHPFARYGRNPDDAGWVHILVLQDPMQLEGSPSSVSDFCSPLTTDAMFLGSPGGTPRLTSPIADTGIDNEGTHLLMLYGLSLRDTDGDGFENSIDTCPFAANVDDPRATNGTDSDMIDPSCDPTPNDNTWGCSQANDHDGDCFQNSQDNCPLESNVSQAQGEQTNTYIAAAPDGGFKSDSIGDACDSEGGGNDDVANGAFLHDMNTDAVCIAVDSGASDPDGDGWCGASPGADPSPNNPNVTGAPDQDTDGDDYPNDDEVFMQTDPLVDCPLVSGSHDAWPPDMDNNKAVNILDLVLGGYKTAYGTTQGVDPAYDNRVDLDANGTINILDLVLGGFKAVYSTSCTP